LDGSSSKPPSLAIMSQVAKSASAFVLALLAIPGLELEGMKFSFAAGREAVHNTIRAREGQL
jgi:hypothetical protein